MVPGDTPSLLLYAAAFVGTAVAAFIAYLKGKQEQAEPNPAKDVLLPALSVADMSPVRELAASAREAAGLLEQIRDMMEAEFAKREERERKAMESENARLREELRDARARTGRRRT